MAREHTGVCRTVGRFGSPAIERMAAAVEAELAADFRPFGATVRVVPIRISHLAEVGEGVALALDPDDPAGWPRWGDFESDVEVRRRRRLSRNWRELLSPADVAAWLRARAGEYLAALEARPFRPGRAR